MKMPLAYSSVPMAPSDNAGDCLIRARKSDVIDFLRIQDDDRFVHLENIRDETAKKAEASQLSRASPPRPASGSVIIHHFAIKSPFFMSLGACRLKRRILVPVLGLLACLSFVSCGSYTKTGPPSGLCCRVLASQGVSSTFSFGSLVMINGQYDILPRVAPMGAGGSPGLMAISPTRNIVAAFDANSNAV